MVYTLCKLPVNFYTISLTYVLIFVTRTIEIATVNNSSFQMNLISKSSVAGFVHFLRGPNFNFACFRYNIFMFSFRLPCWQWQVKQPLRSLTKPWTQRREQFLSDGQCDGTVTTVDPEHK